MTVPGLGLVMAVGPGRPVKTEQQLGFGVVEIRRISGRGRAACRGALRQSRMGQAPPPSCADLSGCFSHVRFADPFEVLAAMTCAEAFEALLHL